GAVGACARRGARGARARARDGVDGSVRRMTGVEQAVASTANRLCPAIADAIAQEMRADERVVIWGEDIRTGVMSTTRGLHAEFGDDRVVDTPISEAGFLGAA